MTKPGPSAPPLTIGIRTDAGPDVGLGHIVRMVGLADILRSEIAGKHRIFFRGNNAAQIYAARNTFPCVPDDGPVEDVDAWVVDLQEGCPPSVARRYREHCNVLVIMNGVGYGGDDVARFLADLVFYQGCSERPYGMDWEGFEGRWYEGARWVIMRPAFFQRRRRFASGQPPKDGMVFISGGGANKEDAASLIAEALAPTGAHLRAVLGMRDDGAVRRLEGFGVEVMTQPFQVALMMAQCAYAVVSYGMTALESLCLGLPTVALSRTENHLEGAEIVAKRSRGALLSLGLTDDVTPDMVRRGLEKLKESETAHWNALQWIDGRGAWRVAREIVSACLERRGT